MPRISSVLLIITLLYLSGCKVNFKSVGDIDNACKMMDVQDMLKEVCDDQRKCADYTLTCDALTYTSKVSPHTQRDWKKGYEKYLRKPSRHVQRVHAGIDAYKKWGFGDQRFFMITDNEHDTSKSSHHFYFYLNSHNQPRLVGMTLYNAQSNDVVEYAFTYSETMDDKKHFSPYDRTRELVKRSQHKAR